MTTMTGTPTFSSRNRSRDGWFVRTENWLDERGKPAWIAAMVLGFIFFWPLGLALLAYSSSSRSRSRKMHRSMTMGRPTGNTAFDA